MVLHSKMKESRFLSAADVTPNGNEFWVTGGRNQRTRQVLDTIEVMKVIKMKFWVWTVSDIKLPHADVGHDFKVINESHFIYVKSEIQMDGKGVYILDRLVLLYS